MGRRGARGAAPDWEGSHLEHRALSQGAGRREASLSTGHLPESLSVGVSTDGRRALEADAWPWRGQHKAPESGSDP